MRLCEQ